MNEFAGPVLVITGGTFWDLSSSLSVPLPCHLLFSIVWSILTQTTDADLPYCGQDCLATGGVAASIPAMVSKNFPHVSESNFSAVIQPNTGHGINLHYNATGAYDVINTFLNQKVLGRS